MDLAQYQNWAEMNHFDFVQYAVLEKKNWFRNVEIFHFSQKCQIKHFDTIESIFQNVVLHEENNCFYLILHHNLEKKEEFKNSITSASKMVKTCTKQSKWEREFCSMSFHNFKIIMALSTKKHAFIILYNILLSKIKNCKDNNYISNYGQMQKFSFYQENHCSPSRNPNCTDISGFFSQGEK